MGFGDLKSDDGLKTLNGFLADKSYIEGFVPSQADSVIFAALASAPGSSLGHALRWYNQIKSYSMQEQGSFPGSKKAVTEYGPRGNEQASKDESDSDDFFDTDSEEEETEEEKRIKAERVAAYHAKKSKKATVIAKSAILLDVKPWDDETDLKLMEEKVRTIQCDGLVWGPGKLVPVGYGIRKLQIACVIEDDKVSTDFLDESITAFEDLVQSVDIAAFNKV